MSRRRSGGYEEGYERSSCLWGGEPGSLVRRLAATTQLAGSAVLDLGAGEGKNAHFLASQGAKVTAVELSEAAISNGRKRFGESPNVTWIHSDVGGFAVQDASFNIVVCYGLLHCLSSSGEIASEVERYQRGTTVGGWHVVCAFNSRFQDLSAHPGFNPTLLSHEDYLDLYLDWEVIFTSDQDLHEVHPHNGIAHTHSMTRILARRAD